MSEQDPQVPESSQQQTWQQGPSGPRASFGRRLVAALIDGILYAIVYGIAVALVDVKVAWGLGVLFGLLYSSLLEGGPRGQTLGKMAVDIRVIDFTAGGPIGYARGFVRYLGKIVSTLPCYLGYLWMLWDREKQTWHDKIATTVVVPVEYYPVS